jgi:hypothetical protein
MSNLRPKKTFALDSMAIVESFFKVTLLDSWENRRKFKSQLDL